MKPSVSAASGTSTTGMGGGEEGGGDDGIEGDPPDEPFPTLVPLPMLVPISAADMTFRRNAITSAEYPTPVGATDSMHRGSRHSSWRHSGRVRDRAATLPHET